MLASSSSSVRSEKAREVLSCRRLLAMEAAEGSSGSGEASPAEGAAAGARRLVGRSPASGGGPGAALASVPVWYPTALPAAFSVSGPTGDEWLFLHLLFQRSGIRKQGIEAFMPCFR